MYQLELFEETSHQTYAVIFCTNIMKDHFGNIWERQEIIKTHLTLEAAKGISEEMNMNIYPGKADYYKPMKMDRANFLID